MKKTGKNKEQIGCKQNFNSRNELKIVKSSLLNYHDESVYQNWRNDKYEDERAKSKDNLSRINRSALKEMVREMSAYCDHDNPYQPPRASTSHLITPLTELNN